MAGLMYQGSELPDSVKRAAQGYLDYQKAIGNKLPLAMEGSGLPEGVRKAAQGAIERGPRAAPAPAPQGLMGGWTDGQRMISGGDLKGMAGKAAGALGRAAGPLAAGYAGVEELDKMFGPTKFQNIQTMMEEGRTRRAMEEDPGLAGRGQDTVNRIGANAMEGVRGLMGQGQLQDVPQEQPQMQPEPEMQMDAPQQSPMEVPQNVPQPPKEEVQREVETQRQQIQTGVSAGLKTGEVHISELAKGVVQADAQRSGAKMTPEQEKAAVTDEVMAMKTMNNDDLSRYVSYALIAGGLLASVMDKSGKTAEAFSDSYNKQLDRNLASGKMAQDMKIAQQRAALEGRKVDITDRDVNSKIGDREASQGYRKRELDQGDEKIDVSKQSIQQRANSAAASLGVQREGNQLKREGLMQRDRQFNATLQQGDRKIDSQEGIVDRKITSAEKIAQAKLDAKAAESKEQNAKGVPLSFKDNQGAAKNYYKSQGIDASADLLDATASRLPTIQKSFPDLSLPEQIRLAHKELQGGVVTDEKTLGFFGGKTRLRKPKE